MDRGIVEMVTDHSHAASRSCARAFFVLGPESSGTRLATSILINAGCYGSADHIQPLDRLLGMDEDERKSFLLTLASPDTPTVLRRSIPHDNSIPSFSALSVAFYPRIPHVIVTFRDFHAMVQSQLTNQQHAKDRAEAEHNIALAYRTIFRSVPRSVSITTVSYEALVLDPGAQKRFIESVGLCVPETLIAVYNGNEKYYGTNV